MRLLKQKHSIIHNSVNMLQQIYLFIYSLPCNLVNQRSKLYIFLMAKIKSPFYIWSNASC